MRPIGVSYPEEGVKAGGSTALVHLLAYEDVGIIGKLDQHHWATDTFIHNSSLQLVLEQGLQTIHRRRQRLLGRIGRGLPPV